MNSTRQEIVRHLSKSNVHCRAHKSPQDYIIMVIMNLITRNTHNYNVVQGRSVRVKSDSPANTLKNEKLKVLFYFRRSAVLRTVDHSRTD